MARSKPLPNHSPLAKLSTAYVPTDADAKAIADEFGFTDIRKLRTRMRGAYLWGVNCKEGLPPIAETRKLLSELKTRSEALSEVISKLGYVYPNHLKPLIDGSVYDYLGQIKDDTWLLSNAADLALVSIKDH